MQPDVNLAENRRFAAHLDRQICRLIDKYSNNDNLKSSLTKINPNVA